MNIHIIACVAENNVIGLGGKMPWPRLRSDMTYFRKVTMGCPVIMGRSTFMSLPGHGLDRRINVVITSQYGTDDKTLISPSFDEDVLISSSLCDALRRLELSGWEDVYIIGGQSIYEQAMPFATHMHITELYEDYEGDRFFPEFDATAWKCVGREYPDEDRHICFTEYTRLNF